MSDHQQYSTAESEAESRFRALLTNHALGIVEVTTDGDVALANRALCDWLGTEPSMLAGRSLASILHADDRITLARQLERLASGAIDSTTITHRLRRSAGIDLWVRSTWSARRSGGGEISHLIAIVDNIAQQREDELVRSILEESIRRLEERRRFIDTMLGELPAITWRALPSGICEYLSPQWCAVTGMADGSGLRWLGAIHPDDRGRFAAAWSDTAPFGHEPRRLALRLRRADGAYHRYEVLGAPICDDRGAVLAWTGVFLATPVLSRVPTQRPVSDLTSTSDLPLRALHDRPPELPNGNGYRPL